MRQKNVRRTVDLSPTTHRSLDNFQRDAAGRLGLARVTGQDVLSALVDRLLADSELAEQITAAIGGKRSLTARAGFRTEQAPARPAGAARLGPAFHPRPHGVLNAPNRCTPPR